MTLKQSTLYFYVVCLIVTGVTTLLALLGTFEIRILATTLAIALAGLCCLCCSTYSKRSMTFLPGLVGIVLAGLAAAMMILGVLLAIDSRGYWNTTAVMWVLALAWAYALGLLSVRVKPPHRWIHILSTITLLSLALVIFHMLFIDDNHGILVTVLAVIVFLETSVVHILGKLNKEHAEPTPRTLVLTETEGGRYQDRSGCLYEVRLVSTNRVEDGGATCAQSSG